MRIVLIIVLNYYLFSLVHLGIWRQTLMDGFVVLKVIISTSNVCLHVATQTQVIRHCCWYSRVYYSVAIK